MLKIAIIQFPGSNCERETILAVKRAGMEPVEVLWNTQPSELIKYLGFIIVGGFSYEDRSRAGIIAALDPIMDALVEQGLLGKPILGICNGAQILIEKGLVPGLKNQQLGAALAENIRVQNQQIQGSGYYNAWVSMKLSLQTQTTQQNAFTRYLKVDDVLSIPVAHGEGRFVMPQELMKEIHANGQNVFQYCDEYGQVLNEFPINPNGSIDNIAALSNKSGNILAMMPHPERTEKCDVIFHSMRDYICDEYFVPMKHSECLNYRPKKTEVFSYPKDISHNHFEILVDSILVDNHSMSIEAALKKQSILVNIHRYVHWGIECDSSEVFEKITQSGVIFNDQKERIIPAETFKEESSFYLLIEPKIEIEGKKTQQIFEKHFQIHGIKKILKNIVWKISTNDSNLSQDTLDHILNSHILFNPYADNCYKY